MKNIFSEHVSLGALGDSFYEYLIKTWVLTNKRDTQAKRMYDQSMQVGEGLQFPSDGKKSVRVCWAVC